MRKTSTLLYPLLTGIFLLFASSGFAQLLLWPGDINDNGIVNGKDVLRWGYANGATGTARLTGNGSAWTALNVGLPWSEQFPGETNFSYGDCDGNGIIDLDDVDGPISSHFGNTHGVVQPDFCPVGTEDASPPLQFIADKASYPTGARIDLEVRLGTGTLPVADFYGITFQLKYNRDIIRPGAVTYTPLENAWYDPTNTAAYSFFENEVSTGTIEIAVTRTDQEGVAGHGVLGHLSLILRGNIDLVLPGALNLELDLVQMINSEMEIIPVYYEPDLNIIISDGDPGGNCPNLIDPVCGSDGRTYINSCYAEAAGITDYTQGVCYSDCIDPSLMRPDAECETTAIDPVCGCNNITYSNPCLAEAAGVKNYTAGPCSTAPDDRTCYDPILVVQSTGTTVNEDSGVISVDCPSANEPVCGCNGITYPNACMAEASGIAFYTPGTCNDECIDPSIMDPDAACESVYEPVCGCNDITYSNACIAESAGVTFYTPGACGQNSVWCAEATPIQCGDFLAQETTVGYGNQLTNYPGCVPYNFLGPDRVYVFDKKTAGDLQIGLEILTPNADLDLFLLKGTCDEVVCIGSSTTSNKKTNNEGIVLEDAPLGTYYIVVDGQFADSEGRFRLEVNCGYLQCGDAIELDCGIPFSYNNKNGEDDVSLYTCGPNVLNVENNGPEIVHYFTTTTAGEVEIELRGLSANLELFLLGDCDRGACMQYSENPGTAAESITTYLEPGTYYVVVDGYNGATSDYTLQVNCQNTCNMEFSSITATPSTCSTNNGTIKIVSSGGTPSYIVYYSGPVSGSFSTSSNSCTIYYLPAGTYQIRKIDARGCEIKETVTISSTGTLSAQVSASNAVCDEPGTITVNLQGGSPPYRVYISGAVEEDLLINSSNFILSELGAGTYDLYIIDSKGCSVSKKATIQEAESNFSFSLTPYPAGCGDLGYVQVITQNGSGPYRLQLSGPVGGNASANSSAFKLTKLPGGTYTLTVRDENGCSFTDNFTIGDINLELNTTVNSGICGQPGSILVQITNGAGGYTINWSGAASGSVNTTSDTYLIPDLPSGDYQIEVTDANQCTGFEVAGVNNSGENISTGVQPIDGTCGENGALLIAVNNGAPPYSISWSGPVSGQTQITNNAYTIPDLPDGLYEVNISDSNNCRDEQSAYVNIESALKISLEGFDGSCGQDGSIRVQMTGGQANYIVSWSGTQNGSATATQNTFDISGLASGTYEVSITDARGCTTAATQSIKNAEGLLVLDPSPQTATCDQPGAIALAVSGGVATYQITWKGPVTGEATTDADGKLLIPDLIAGNYELSATDQNGCTGTTTITVGTDSGNVGISLSGQAPICTSPGRINVNITDGNPDYSVSWEGPVNGTTSTGASSFAIVDLPAGSYKVTVVDQFGCVAVDNITLVQTGNLDLTAAAQNAACGIGQINIQIDQGNPSFDISWEGPVSGSITTTNVNYTIPELPDGTYDITVSDLNGCTDVTQVSIFSGSQPEIIATPQPGVCGANGMISLSVSGGAPDFKLSWSGPASGSRTMSGNFFNINDLPDGSYTIQLTDKNGCSDEVTVELNNETSDLDLTVSLVENECGQENTIALNISGGVADFIISWSGPQNGTRSTTESNPTIQDLPAGDYEILVTDANTCSVARTISVPVAPIDLLSLQANPGVCGQTGSIQALISGGTPGFTLSWSGPVSGSLTTSDEKVDLPALPSGTYSVVLTDANGCSETEVIDLDNDQTDLIVSLSLVNNECGLPHNILVQVSGGVSNYLINWSGPERGTAATPGNGYVIENLAEGNYTVKVTDQNGCTITKNIEVVEVSLNILRLRGEPGKCGEAGRIKLTISGGEPDYDISWSGPVNGNANTNDLEYFITDLPPGEYLVTLDDINGCLVNKSVVLQASTNLDVSVNGEDGTCTEAPIITVDILSGSPGYSISWNGPVNGTLTTTNPTYRIEGLVAGTYELNIKDALGCELTETITVSGGDSNLAVEVGGNNGTCGNNGAIAIGISGGNPDFVINWDGPVSGNTSITESDFLIDNLPDGTYSVSVTDQNGCSEQNEVTIVNQPDIDVAFTAAPGNCGKLGSIQVDFVGTPPFTVSWAGPSSGSQGVNNNFYAISNLESGTYEVTVSDQNNCAYTETIGIENQVNDLNFTANPTSGGCNQPGAISLNISGGEADYTVEWTGAGTQGSITTNGNPTLAELPGGTYTIRVTDQAGCTVQKQVQLVTIVNTVSLSTSLVHPSCNNKGSITLNVNGSFPSFTIQWSGPVSGEASAGNGSFTIPNLEAGGYIITVSDINGCSRTENFTLNNSVGTPDAFFDHSNDNLTISFNPNGATGDYSWDFGDGNTNTASEPKYEYCDPGTYTVCLTVTNGCGTDTYCEDVTVSIADDLALLEVGDLRASVGSQVQVPVTVSQLDRLVSMEGSLALDDPTVAQVTGLSPGLIAPQYISQEQSFTFYQNDQEGVILKDDDILFYIDLQVSGAPGTSSFIRLTGDPKNLEVGGLSNGLAVIIPHFTLKGQLTVAEFGRISGQVSTYWGAPIPNTEMHLTGTDLDLNAPTNTGGDFLFPDLNLSREYTVRAEKDEFPFNGLSTYSLFIGQRYILGMEPEQIVSPYQIIAGDANCNGSFTTLDLFIIQQLIVGATDHFTYCPSWVFVSEDNTMPVEFDAYNVFPYLDYKTLTLGGDRTTSFFGVKVGDILGQADPEAIKGDTEVEVRNPVYLDLQSTNRRLEAGATFTLQLTSDAFQDIVSYQFGLAFDPDRLRFLEFEKSGHTDLAGALAGTRLVDKGRLAFSWFSQRGSGISADDDEALFTVHFEALEAIDDLSKIITIQDLPLRAEAHTGSGDKYKLQLNWQTEENPASTPETPIFQLYQNMPNPASKQTRIRFDLPESDSGVLILQDKLGRIIERRNGDFAAGTNYLTLPLDRLQGGVYYYTLTAGPHTATRSMIVVK